MRPHLTAEDVISDIEFELIQGAISQDELGQAIASVRRYQNKVRGDLFQQKHRRDKSEITARQFQINDMLLTILQETIAEIQSLRLEFSRAAHLSKSAKPTYRYEPPVQKLDVVAPTQPVGKERPFCIYTPEDFRKVENRMRPESLQVEISVRATKMPFVGAVLNRLRVIMHNLVLFYINRLATNQGVVNQTYGDYILRLMRQVQYQQEQIEMLQAQIETLRASLLTEESATDRYLR
jgi:flagellar biosynthesis chaperone FliJ